LTKDTILIIDSKEEFIEVSGYLGNRYNYVHCQGAQEALGIFDTHKDNISAVISGMDLTCPDNMELLKKILERNWSSTFPIFVISDSGMEDYVNQLYAVGNVYCWMRPINPLIFTHNVEALIKAAKYRIHGDKKLKAHEYKASHDEVTGLLNQVAFRQIAETLIIDNPHKTYTMAVVDVDRFTTLTDKFGKELGDRVLKKVADTINELMPENPLLGKVGTDEFVIMTSSNVNLYELGERLVSGLRLKEDKAEITVSVGIAKGTATGRKFNDIYLGADFAVYEAKRQGRNCFSVYKKNSEETFHSSSIGRNSDTGTGEGAVGAFFIYDADRVGEIKYVSDAVVKMYGYDTTEEFLAAVDYKFENMVYIEDRIEVLNSISEQVIGFDGEYDYVEYRIRKRDGSIVWVEDHGRYTQSVEYGNSYYVFIKEIVRDPKGTKQKILIVDDLEYNRTMMEDILCDYYDIVHASGGKEAIELIQENHNEYVMVLLDLIMPDVDGYDVLKYMNNNDIVLPVVVISSDTNAERINMAYGLGALDVIARPYHPGNVKRRIRNSIELYLKEVTVPESAYRPKNILVVGASPLSRYFISKMLCDEYEITTAASENDAKVIMMNSTVEYALVIQDMSTPDNMGYGLVEWMKAREDFAKIPVLAETVYGQYDENLHALYAGVSDFIIKPYRVEIVKNRIAAVITNRESISLVARMKFDTVTKGYTDNFFKYLLEEIFKKNPTKNFDIVWLDIKGFSTINATYGMDQGDRLLAYVGDVISEQKGIGAFARISADRFAIVYVHNHEATLNSVKNIQDTIYSRAPGVSITCGIYEKIDKDLKINDILDKAKMASDTLSNTYASAYAYYDESMMSDLIKEQKIADMLSDAITNEEFQVYYQPKISLKTGTIAGMEALVRWQHPTKGMISPGDFIPLAEKNGFISKIDSYVFDRVVKDIADWKERGLELYPVSINSSRRDFSYDQMFSDGFEEMARNNVDPKYIHMEVTESLYADNFGKIVEVSNRVRDKGIKVEIDDFGSGYSSLGVLTEMPLDVVKLDISFVRNIEKKGKVIRSIINLSHELGFEVVAEGAEKQEQVDILTEMKCDYVQGFYFSRPLPKQELEEKYLR